MKYLLLAILMLVAGESWGQVKLYRSVDKFSGDSIISTGTDTLDGTRVSKKQYILSCTVKGYLTKTSEAKFYSLYFSFHHLDAFSLSEKNNLIIKFSDNSKIQLQYQGKYSIYGSSEEATFSVSPKNYLQELSTKDIISIRFETSDIPYDFIIKDQFKGKLKAIMTDFINN